MSFDPTADLPFGLKQAEATILAALKFYQHHDQGEPDNRDNYIHDLATGGDVVSLDEQGIDDVYEAFVAGRLKIREVPAWNTLAPLEEIEAAEIVARLRVYVVKFGDDDGELQLLQGLQGISGLEGPLTEVLTGSGDFDERDVLVSDDEGNGFVLDPEDVDVRLLRRIVDAVEAQVFNTSRKLP